MAIEKCVGSLDEFETMEWCVMTWVNGGIMSMEEFPTFKAFLVSKVEKSSVINGRPRI